MVEPEPIIVDGKNERELIIGVWADVKLIKQTLQGADGEEGLCEKVARIEDEVDAHDKILTKHAVYFTIIGSAVAIAITVALWAVDKI